MFCTDLMELLSHDVFGKFGFVALAAQVREVKLPETGRHGLRDGLGGRDIGDVAVTAEDALLERPGAARAILQHFHIVVGFEDEDVRGADAFEHEFGDVAEVGGKADRAGLSSKREADGILGVVWDGKCLDAYVADFKTCTGLEQPPVNLLFQMRCAVNTLEGRFLLRVPFGFHCPDCAVLRSTIAEDGDVEFVRKAQDAGDMVGMFVGDEDGGKIFRRPTDGGQALAYL